MGRTNPTFRDFLDRYEDDWAAFRRGLRRRHKPHFDRLFERARRHADAAGYANAADPEIAFLVSVLLAQEVELQRLRERVEDVAGDGGEGATGKGDEGATGKGGEGATGKGDEGATGKGGEGATGEKGEGGNHASGTD